MSLSRRSLPIILQGELLQVENDCACPSPAHVTSLIQPVGYAFQRVPELHTQNLDDEWSLFYNSIMGGPPFILNSAAQERLATFREPHVLIDSIDQQLAHANLITPSDASSPAIAYKTSTLTVWLHITNACNLECPYCYVRKSGAKMTLSIGIAAIDAVIMTAKRHGFTTVKLKYAGGEATLHYQLVQQLHAYAEQQATTNDLTLQAVVLSNGTVMPPAFVEWLASADVKLMLSVDGVGDDHDQQRPWKVRGAGAFSALEHNLTKQLLPRGIRPNVCVTITAHNAATIHRTIEWILHYDLPFTLNLYRENELAATHKDLQFEEHQIIAGLQRAYAVIEQELPDRPLLNGLLDYLQAEAHTHTCGVGQSYLVITHEGKIAQCHMTLDRVQTFQRTDDLIQLVAVGDIHNISVDEKEGCKNCSWRYQCAGGCPITTLRATGRFDIKSPNCHIYQTLFPAALRLEGLRLLKGYLTITQKSDVDDCNSPAGRHRHAG